MDTFDLVLHSTVETVKQCSITIMSCYFTHLHLAQMIQEISILKYAIKGTTTTFCTFEYCIACTTCMLSLPEEIITEPDI